MNSKQYSNVKKYTHSLTHVIYKVVCKCTNFVSSFLVCLSVFKFSKNKNQGPGGRTNRLRGLSVRLEAMHVLHGTIGVVCLLCCVVCCTK